MVVKSISINNILKDAENALDLAHAINASCHLYIHTKQETSIIINIKVLIIYLGFL